MKHLLLLIPFLLVGCTTRLGDFTIASTKNIDIENGNFEIQDNVRVQGIHEESIIILFPTGQISLDEAIDNAIEKTPNAIGLSDVTIKHNFWYIPYIYGKSSYEVEGNPVLKVNKTQSAK